MEENKMTVEEFYLLLQFIKNVVGEYNADASINDIMDYLNNGCIAENTDRIAYVLDGAMIV